MAIKETQEFIELLDVLGDAIIDAKQDGKVDWKDLPKIVPVLGQMRLAAVGADKIMQEMQEISESPAMTQLVLQQTLDAALKLARAVIA